MPKRRSRGEWQELVRQQASSGETQQGFCKSHGLAVSSFQNWRRKLREEAFIELPVASREEEERGGSSAVIELPCGATVRFSW